MKPTYPVPSPHSGNPLQHASRLRLLLIAALISLLFVMLAMIAGADGLGLLIVTPLLAVAVGVYLLPMIIAMKRRHPDFRLLALLNILAGWTFLGWVGALAWAVMPEMLGRPATLPDGEASVAPSTPALDRPDLIDASFVTLRSLLADGHISPEEYELKRAELLSRL